MPGAPVRPGPRPSATASAGQAPGAQQQMRPSTMNARPITGQSGAQARPGMSMPQSSMQGRPQQPQAPTMPQGARPGYSQFQNRPQVRKHFVCGKVMVITNITLPLCSLVTSLNYTKLQLFSVYNGRTKCCCIYRSEWVVYTECILIQLWRKVLACRNTLESVPGTN